MTLTADLVEPLTKHPAPFSTEILDVARSLLRIEARRLRRDRRLRVLDPFAGIGRVHQLDDLADTTGVEIRPRWAACHPRTRVGDATRLPHWWTRRFDVVFTSPCYGNRYADHHDNRDTCKRCDGRGYLAAAGDTSTQCATCKGAGLSVRRSYHHDYGDPDWSHPNDAGVVAFGVDYVDLHERAWRQVHRVLADDGAFLLNVSNFTRRKRDVDVVNTHAALARDVGFRLVRTINVETRRMRFGANRDARASHEVIHVLRKAA